MHNTWIPTIYWLVPINFWCVPMIFWPFPKICWSNCIDIRSENTNKLWVRTKSLWDMIKKSWERTKKSWQLTNKSWETLKCYKKGICDFLGTSNAYISQQLVPTRPSKKPTFPSNSSRTLLRRCLQYLRRRPVWPASLIRLKSISQQPVMTSCSGGKIAAARTAHISPFTSGTTTPSLRRIPRHQWGGMRPHPLSVERNSSSGVACDLAPFPSTAAARRHGTSLPLHWHYCCSGAALDLAPSHCSTTAAAGHDISPRLRRTQRQQIAPPMTAQQLGRMTIRPLHCRRSLGCSPTTPSVAANGPQICRWREKEGMIKFSELHDFFRRFAQRA